MDNQGSTITSNSDKKWTMHYFTLHGRAEALRMAMVHGKIDFEDHRMPFGSDEWTAFKSSDMCPNGQVPVLQVGDKILNQSEATIRFIGIHSGAYSVNDPMACHAADCVINTHNDLMNVHPKCEKGNPLFYQMIFSTDPISDENVAAMVEWRKSYHVTMSGLLKEAKFFGGSKPSIADFWVFGELSTFEKNTNGIDLQSHVYKGFADALNEQPTLKAWADRMSEELKDWLSKRESCVI